MAPFQRAPHYIHLSVGTVLMGESGPEINLFVYMDAGNSAAVIKRFEEGNAINEFGYKVSVIWPDPHRPKIPIEMAQIARFGEVIMDGERKWPKFKTDIEAAFAFDPTEGIDVDPAGHPRGKSSFPRGAVEQDFIDALEHFITSGDIPSPRGTGDYDLEADDRMVDELITLLDDLRAGKEPF